MEINEFKMKENHHGEPAQDIQSSLEKTRSFLEEARTMAKAIVQEIAELSRQLTEAIAGLDEIALMEEVPNAVKREFQAGPNQKVLTSIRGTGDREPRIDDLNRNFFSPSVLVAEDNVCSQKLVSHFLKHQGCEVTLAQNGQEALEFARDNQYHLILLDIEMPVMDGYIAIRKIRKITGCKNVPIVAMTAYQPEEDQGKCLEAGFSEYLSKPIREKDITGLLYRLYPERPDVSEDPSVSSSLEKTLDLFSEEFHDPRVNYIAELYINNLEERVAEAKAILEKKDERKLKSWVHNLKGVSGNLGLKSLSQWAKNLENLYKRNEFSWDGVEGEIREFKALVKKIRESCQKMDEHHNGFIPT